MWVQSLSSALRHRGLPCSGEEQQAGSRQPTGASQAALSASGLCPGGKVTFHAMTEAGDALCSPVLGPEAEPHRSELWFLFPKPISPSPASSGSQQSILGGGHVGKAKSHQKSKAECFPEQHFCPKRVKQPSYELWWRYFPFPSFCLQLLRCVLYQCSLFSFHRKRSSQRRLQLCSPFTASANYPDNGAVCCESCGRGFSCEARLGRLTARSRGLGSGPPGRWF